MFKEFFTGVQDKYKKMQEEEARYQELLGKVFTLPSFYPFSPVDKRKLTISYKLLMDMCPDLNEKDAILIRGLIPMDELVFSCLYASECKTGVKFYFVATTKYLWLIQEGGYLKYQYVDLSVEIIKNGLMSRILLMGNMLFTVNGLKDAIDLFVKLFQDGNYREELIHKKLDMFCGVMPQVFYLNSISSGISVGNHKEIVFHTKEFHRKYLISDLKNYELLLDDMVVREKKSSRRGRLTANKTSCYQMALRVTAKEQNFVLPILERSSFSSLYSSTSVVFMENKAFADKIIDILDEMDEAMLNGEL